jgi:hypothetical protein
MTCTQPIFIATAAVAAMLLAIGGRVARAAEWQWSAEVASVVSDETKAHPRAFLWIPPGCTQVRGVVLGQHNMIEEGILEHPAMRRTLAEIGFAEIWVTPAFDGIFRFDQGAGAHFQNMMDALAAVSGYSELTFAPVVPIGHSAMASFPYHFAAWNPRRTLAAISHKGTWPDFRADDASWPPRHDGDLDGVPLLFFNGEYEDASGRAAKALEFRKRNPNCPLTMCADAGGGHFDFHDRMVEYLALYIRTAAKYRLPDESPTDAPVALKTIDPTKTGWLAERWRPNSAPKFAPAPPAEYQGDPNEAFWFFDGELARATEAYNAREIAKQPQLLGYLQEGKLVPQDAPHTHQQVSLKFLSVEDGLTFKVVGRFLDTVPDGRPETWTGLPAGSHIGHPAGGPVVIDRICGPVKKLAPDTFAVRFYRMGLNNPKRTNDIWLMATHPGDAHFKRAVQQADLRIPYRNKVGADQTLTFPDIGDVNVETTTVELRATSSAGAKVYYYVREGPAEVDDEGNLTFTPIPPRAKHPVKVTVVAWQWGRSIEPKLKSAEPVERTFAILPPNPSGDR